MYKTGHVTEAELVFVCTKILVLVMPHINIPPGLAPVHHIFNMGILSLIVYIIVTLPSFRTSEQLFS